MREFSLGTQRAGLGAAFLSTLLTVGAVWLATSPPALGACSTGPAAFSATGMEQCYTVPAGISELQIVAIGGQGGAGTLGEAGGSARR